MPTRLAALVRSLTPSRVAVASRGGLEPPTSSSGNWCSVRLSYHDRWPRAVRSLGPFQLDEPERWTPRRESNSHLHRGMVASLPLDNARMARTGGIEPPWTGFGIRRLAIRPDP